VYRIGDLLELGDVARADPEIERYREQAEHLRQPWYIWYGALFLATRALMDGRFADAEQLATEAVALGDRARDPNALQFYGTQMLWAWREQGRTAELESFYQVIFEASAAIPAAQAALCWVAADVGRLDEARERFEQLAADDFASLPRDLTWLAGIALVTLVCHALSDAPRAKVLYGQLEPYSHRNVMPWPIFYMGPVDYYKGLLAATAGDFEAARGHFETALASSEATGARPFVAHAQADLGALLVEHGPDADRVRGTQLLERALATARELGMAPLEEWARARMHAATSG
jgi:tetratricopeptide (TPR) repeat protein